MAHSELARPTNAGQENPLELRPKNPETPLMNPPSELGPDHAALPTTSRVREVELGALIVNTAKES